MKFRVICEHTSNKAQSPYRVVEQETGREVDWINEYLDREAVRRLSENSLRLYADELLYFVRWWASIHHTAAVAEGDLTESTLLDYVRFQSAQQPTPAASTVNHRVAVADRALRNAFPDAPCQVARGGQHGDRSSGHAFVVPYRDAWQFEGVWRRTLDRRTARGKEPMELARSGRDRH